ncbi:MAG: transposase [Kiritimatiellae bacterium]|nr:transposase [Kiritimatiellia bacterium]
MIFPFKSLNPHYTIEKHLNRLPHWEQDGCLQFVTWSLGDALPAVKRRQLMAEREEWLRLHPEPRPPEMEREVHTLFTERIQQWLDAGSGECLLRVARHARIVADALHHFDGDRLRLDSYVVMPNHVHVLFLISPDQSLSGILQSWKGFTSRQINQCLNRKGSLWMKDYWDRLIRSPEHYQYVRRYIAQNPAKAKLAPGSYLLWQRS